ncbi:hypothetical protein [Nonomuraea insulae]|uniref:Uncharacterized protein n=1 Tax=Nonomuraea insulae TaxID=1616787 RepID=A0ABW1CLQ5_9ACTN
MLPGPSNSAAPPVVQGPRANRRACTAPVLVTSRRSGRWTSSSPYASRHSPLANSPAISGSALSRTLGPGWDASMSARAVVDPGTVGLEARHRGRPPQRMAARFRDQRHCALAT